MASPIFLTEQDKALIQGLLDQERKRSPQGHALDTVGEGHQSPEVYVIETPDTYGIPALTEGSPDIPGMAVCNVYRILDGDLIAVDGLTREVYNLGTEALHGWTLGHKDKFGRWVAGLKGSTLCTTIHLPTKDPPGLNSHLYVHSLQAPHVQTEWGAQGVTGSFQVYAPECGQDGCITIWIQRGIVTYISGGLGTIPVPGDQGLILNNEVFAKCHTATVENTGWFGAGWGQGTWADNSYV